MALSSVMTLLGGLGCQRHLFCIGNLAYARKPLPWQAMATRSFSFDENGVPLSLS
ncbi:hypothetical protein GBA52_015058 [Prunus armeniaca]|nr:hypothetical protein GBA52_015058 [Prunus armeniaca]